MRAHADGGPATASYPHRSPEPIPPRSDKDPSPTSTNTGGGGSGRAATGKQRPLASVPSAAAAAEAAVKKGFLDSGVGGGRLYGEEGSREGGGTAGSGVGGGSGRGGDRSNNRPDREFERLMALADPDMGDDGADGTTGGGKASRSK